MTIHDVRPIVDQLSFERNGFVVVDEPTEVTEFTDKDELARYCRQTEALVQRLTGADKVVSFGPILRTNAPAAPTDTTSRRSAPMSITARAPSRTSPASCCRRRRPNGGSQAGTC